MTFPRWSVRRYDVILVLYVNTRAHAETHTNTHTHTRCHMLLHFTCSGSHDCVWQQWSGTLNCCITLVHRVSVEPYLPVTHTHTCTGRVCVRGTLKWQDLASISFQRTVVIIRFFFFISPSSAPPSSWSHHSHIGLKITSTHEYISLLVVMVKRKRAADEHPKNRSMHAHTNTQTHRRTCQASILSQS